MIDAGHPTVSIERRCELLGLPRSTYYRPPATGLRDGDLELMRRIDELYTLHPWAGSRTFSTLISTPDQFIGRKRISRLMRFMGIESVAPKPGTSKRPSTASCLPVLITGLDH
jgi:putative transposase